MLTGCAMLGIAAIGLTAAPQPAQAWWHHGYDWCCRVAVVVPRVAIAPVYAPSPAYDPPLAYGFAPRPAWVPDHWAGGYWVRGHWG
jgi:hypothetical protein